MEGKTRKKPKPALPPRSPVLIGRRCGTVRSICANLINRCELRPLANMGLVEPLPKFAQGGGVMTTAAQQPAQ